MKFIVGQEVHICVNFLLQCDGERCCLPGCCVERVRLLSL
jgi:hypothetical protein